MTFFWVWAIVGSLLVGFFAHLGTFGVDRGEIGERGGRWYRACAWAVLVGMLVIALLWMPTVEVGLFDWMVTV